MSDKADRAAASLRHYHKNRGAINVRRREARKIAYDERPCDACGELYQPLRSTSQFCQTRACINARQNANRAKRKEKA